MEKTIFFELKENLSIITLNRPEKLNAMNFSMMEELISSLKQATASSSRAVILKATGRIFSCGADISEMKERSAAEWERIVSYYLSPIREIMAMPKPVICQIQGDAVGGALGIALSCDFRLMAEGARLRVPFIDIGLGGGDMGVGYFLPRLVGLGRAKEWMMTGRFITGEEALSSGLLYRLLPKEDLEEAVMELAKMLASKSPHAMRWTKGAANLSLDADIEEEFNFEIFAQVQCLQSEDNKEAVRAFFEKRKPQFKG